MNAMYSAIKGRRGGLMADSEEQAPAQQAPPQKSGGGMNMESLVGALSDDQKSQLLSLLVGGEQSAPQSKQQSDPRAIEKGGMGPGEEAEIEEELGRGDSGEHESEDEIAESMVASSDKMRADRGDKPRNLGERMKFDLAKKLKK